MNRDSAADATAGASIASESGAADRRGPGLRPPGELPERVEAQRRSPEIGDEGCAALVHCHMVPTLTPH